MKKILFLILLASPIGLFAEDLILPLPVGEENNIINNAAKRLGWTATINDPLNPGTTIQNPLTRKQHLLRKLADKVQQDAQAQDNADRAASRKLVTDTLWRINP